MEHDFRIIFISPLSANKVDASYIFIVADMVLLLLRHITFYTIPFGFLWRGDVKNDTILFDFVLSFFFFFKEMLEVCSDQIVSSKQYACMSDERAFRIKSTEYEECERSKYMEQLEE